MTDHTTHIPFEGAPVRAHSTRQLTGKAFEVALALVVLAALTGAWLAFFTFLPLEFTPPRVG